MLAGNIGMEGYNTEYNAITSAGPVKLYILRSLAPLRFSASSRVSKPLVTA